MTPRRHRESSFIGKGVSYRLWHTEPTQAGAVGKKDGNDLLDLGTILRVLHPKV
jgi:hypothetical protein